MEEKLRFNFLDSNPSSIIPSPLSVCAPLPSLPWRIWFGSFVSKKLPKRSHAAFASAVFLARWPRGAVPHIQHSSLLVSMGTAFFLDHLSSEASSPWPCPPLPLPTGQQGLTVLDVAHKLAVCHLYQYFSERCRSPLHSK